MAKICAKCSEKANVSVNILNYCNDCFLTMLKGKIQKNLHKIRTNANILIYIKNDSFSNAYIELLKEFFDENNRFNVEVFWDEKILEKFKGLKKSNPEEFIDESKDNFHLALNDYCHKNNIELILFCRNIESLAADSIDLFCSGKGREACEKVKMNDFTGIKTVNPFHDVRAKELAYFCYIKDVERNKSNKQPNKARVIIENFLEEINTKNNSCGFK